MRVLVLWCPGQGTTLNEKAKTPAPRIFQPLVDAISEITPLVEILQPGLYALDVRGPARYFGGEDMLCRRVREAASAAMPALATESAGAAERAADLPGCQIPPGCSVGIADGYFAAMLAAQKDLVIPRGEERAFLASLPLATLRLATLLHYPGIPERLVGPVAKPDSPGLGELLDLLGVLGIHTLGAFAALPPAAVLERFGRVAWHAHALARGMDDRPLCPSLPSKEPMAAADLDPPADRADAAAFAARPVAAELLRQLLQRGVVCARLRIEIEAEHGERLVRSWRCEGELSEETIVERVRWQIGGWVAGNTREALPGSGIATVRLVADEVVPAGDMQLQLWPGAIGYQAERDSVIAASAFHTPSARASRASSPDRSAMRCADRLCGMLGPGAVFTARLQGGRGPAERIVFVPWNDDAPAHPRAAQPAAHPWPGHLPPPAPAIVHPEPLKAEVVAQDGSAVAVDGRGGLSNQPAWIALSGSQWTAVVAWAGPWLSDERWWDPPQRRRRARFQLLAEDVQAGPAVASPAGSTAHLCFVEHGRWWVEATYG
ncbi:MAG: hypothetical protein ACYDEY_11210 [Acidimicrobiales bacterium]